MNFKCFLENCAYRRDKKENKLQCKIEMTSKRRKDDDKRMKIKQSCGIKKRRRKLSTCEMSCNICMEKNNIENISVHINCEFTYAGDEKSKTKYIERIVKNDFAKKRKHCEASERRIKKEEKKQTK